jgi:hypothetical protein
MFICHYPSGYYNEVAAIAEGDQYALADLDGDGNLDFAVASRTDIRALFGAGDGTFGPPVVFGAAAPQSGDFGRVLATGDLDGDGHPDFAFGVPGGIGVVHATGARRLEPITLPTIDTSASIVGAEILIPVHADGPDPFDHIFDIGTDANGNAALAVEDWDGLSDAPLVLADTTFQLKQLPKIGLANVDTSPARNGVEAALAFEDSPVVHVVSFVPNALGGFDVIERSQVTLPGIPSVPPIFGDVDGDGMLDLIAPFGGDGSGQDPADHVAVAHGFGDGTFGPAVRSALFDQGMDQVGNPLALLPLAAVDLDGDGVTDYVTCYDIALHHGSKLVEIAQHGDAAACSLEAVVVDLNRDGRPDVARFVDTDVVIDINGPVGFSPITVTGTDFSGQIRAGDFDGDRVDDLAVTTFGGSLRIIYGATSGQPVAVDIATSVDSMEPGVLAPLPSNDGIDHADTTTDLIVNYSAGVAYLAGDSHRTMFAPYTLATDAVALGHFDANDQADLLAHAFESFVIGSAPPAGALHPVSIGPGLPALADVFVEVDDLTPIDLGDPTAAVVAAVIDKGDTVFIVGRVSDPATGTQLDGAQRTISTQSLSRLAAVADVDRDGHPDAVFCYDQHQLPSPPGLGVQVWLGIDGDLAAAPVTTLAGYNTADTVAVLNADADPELEMVVAIDDKLRLADQTSDHNFVAKDDHALAVLPDIPLHSTLLVADIDRDGLDDIVWIANVNGISTAHVFLAVQGSPLGGDTP